MSLHRNEFVLSIAVGIFLPKTSASKGNGRSLQVLRQRILSIMVSVDNLLTQVSASPQAEDGLEAAAVSRAAEVHYYQASDDYERGNRDGEPVRQPEPVASVLVHR
jgi:hypothetical protein